MISKLVFYVFKMILDFLSYKILDVCFGFWFYFYLENLSCKINDIDFEILLFLKILLFLIIIMYNL